MSDLGEQLKNERHERVIHQMKKEEDEWTTSFTKGFMGAVTLVLLPVAYLLEAFVVRELWKWYVIPTFHLPPLTIPIALGWGLLVSALTPTTSLSKECIKEPHMQVFDALLRSGVLYGIGALGTLWL